MYSPFLTIAVSILWYVPKDRREYSLPIFQSFYPAEMLTPEAASPSLFNASIQTQRLQLFHRESNAIQDAVNYAVDGFQVNLSSFQATQQRAQFHSCQIIEERKACVFP